MKLLEKLRGLFGLASKSNADRRPIAIEQATAYLKLLDPESENTIELSEQDAPVMSPFVGDLLIAYVVDIGPAFQFIQGRDLDLLGMDHEQLQEIAVRNLSQKLSDEALDIRQMGEIYALFLDGHFEASLMLADDLWDEVMIEHLPGDVVAAVPSRDVLIFCDASSAEAIENLKTQVERLDEGTHPLSKGLFRRNRISKTWQVLKH